MTIKKGDRVYRVESTCLDAPHPPFCVAWRTIDTISAVQLRLKAPFSEVSGVVFRGIRPGLGASFFATPAEAVEAFKRKSARARAMAEGAIKDAEVKDAWADQWLASDDKPIAAQRRRSV